MAHLKTPLKNFLIGIDQTINTLVWIKGDGLGLPDETLSARAWRLRTQSNAWKRIDRLMFFDPDHCRTSFEAELNRKQLPQEYQQGRGNGEREDTENTLAR